MVGEDEGLTGLLGQHKITSNEYGEWYCTGCDLRWDRDYSMAKFHYETHIGKLQSAWLKDHEYGYPNLWLTPGTSCLRCGVVVGLIDVHRKVCHG